MDKYVILCIILRKNYCQKYFVPDPQDIALKTHNQSYKSLYTSTKNVDKKRAQLVYIEHSI